MDATLNDNTCEHVPDGKKVRNANHVANSHSILKEHKHGSLFGQAINRTSTRMKLS